MKNLVLYTTKHGSVEKAARILAVQLPGETTFVNLKKDKVPDLAAFDTIILGGSAYMGRVQKELTRFMTARQNDLLKKKLALFLVAGEDREDRKHLQFERCFPETLRNRAAAVSYSLGHAVYWEKMSLFEKIMLRLVKSLRAGYESYYTDEIARFAKAIAR